MVIVICDHIHFAFLPLTILPNISPPFADRERHKRKASLQAIFVALATYNGFIDKPEIFLILMIQNIRHRLFMGNGDHGYARFDKRKMKAV